MDKRFTSCTPELWGGIECSFNRVGDRVIDQLEYAKHYERGEADIDSFASLGIKAIRYPVIWEKHQPMLNKPIDWKWTTSQLNALRTAGIEPIAGLLHHGNGPSFTSLLDPEFPTRFATYARLVAEQFPWIQYYTPINEPLTTARFSGLYGIWYPHSKNDRDFAFIMLNQMKGIVLAMEQIRKVNPQAVLIQTEDLPKTYSTPSLQYQADFENERRWLTYDLLCGRFRPGHGLWDFFAQQKLPADLMGFFSDNICPPQIIGADYYLTSERFLDHNVDKYPQLKKGGNHQDVYVDVEAFRVNHSYPWGLKTLLKECWDRYKLPIALTEVHIHGDSSDQIRWFDEVWNIAKMMNADGMDIKAVTTWSLLGAYGWSTLLTLPEGDYESGPFNVSSGEIEATEFAGYLRMLSKNANGKHAALREKGWWQTKTRCFYNLDPKCEGTDVLRASV